MKLRNCYSVRRYKTPSEESKLEIKTKWLRSTTDALDDDSDNDADNVETENFNTTKNKILNDCQNSPSHL